MDAPLRHLRFDLWTAVATTPSFDPWSVVTSSSTVYPSRLVAPFGARFFKS